MITYIGIDIGKIELQIHFNGQDIVIKNSIREINLFLNSLDEQKDYVIVFEPTGGYERPLRQTIYIWRQENC
ncbi:hypothetical protein L3V79_09260 [Thiotrichales bacterium 19S9-12]|nr:hypothetical protein [Thiotrichales bacterium 19S9-11]MCF6812546.1 hypothetical protein [Thiotrichales bacterium 19S9-12]